MIGDAGLEGALDSELARLAHEAAEVALDREHRKGPDTVTVMIAADDRLRDLNQQFNDDDSVTDVLSFNESPGWREGEPPETPQGEFLSMAGAGQRLGDIVISLPQVERQAGEAGHEVGRELAMLSAHGVLHLLGYDHAEADKQRVMFSKTDQILEQVFTDDDQR